MRMKRVLCILLAAVLIAAAFAGCSAAGKTEDEPTVSAEAVSAESTTKETTTTTTKPTTTEDPDTTFPESPTRTVYKGLEKGNGDDFNYKISEYTTYYNPGQVSRTANVANAARKIDSIVIPSGQVFSFNQTVGRRTVTAGFETAGIYRDGEMAEGLGGGICQVSSTIFQAILRANCDIVERSAHSLEVHYVPKGGDATVNWPTQDFQFRNSLKSDIQLRLYCSGGSLTCKVYSRKKVKVGDVQISITSSGGGYYLTRTVNGKKNYSCSSRYRTPKPSTTAKPDNEEENEDEED
jgi:hypothetical protein